ncbi:MAG TPA: hypothetical protein PK110_02310 [Niabella sp.]|jgi:hypothetical protein|nr:hypothetical protein [Chitinophagaceae bacterium]HRN48697.1 hypothetical protein [Niabella sp.]HRO83634.1 hypothetical protein [Niabella sp.]HUN04265.1 hypothetical protein [Niabella sp.]
MKQHEIDMIIDEFIDLEKKKIPLPFFATGVMAQIETSDIKKNHSLWSVVAVAASLTIAISGGVLIGSSYRQSNSEISYTVINDHQIENMQFFNDSDSE